MAAPNTTPRRGLTPAFIDTLSGGEKRYSIPDRRAPGLILRVTPNGGRSFSWVCNAGSGSSPSARGR